MNLHEIRVYDEHGGFAVFQVVAATVRQAVNKAVRLHPHAAEFEYVGTR